MNRPEDVKTVQALLNKNIAKLAPLLPCVISGSCDAQTILMIEHFQRQVLRMPRPDGRVDPNGRFLKSSGLRRATVTSVSRTPAEQARVMYENCVSKGAEFNKKMYAAAGDRVVEVYIANKDKSRSVVIELMLAKIREIGPGKVSKHISDTHYTFDVAPSSIPPAKHADFLAAINSHKAVSKVISPPTDAAFHIEVPKNSPYL